MRLIRAALALCIAAGSLLLSAGPAAAHGEIRSTRPAPGATRAKPVKHVRIEFTEAPTEDSSIRVRDACGRDIVRERYVEGRTAHVFLRAGRAVPGEWEVSYRVLSSEDGHLTRGGFTFTVEGETDCTEPDEPADEPDGSDDPADEPGDADANRGAAVGDTPARDEGSDFPLVPALLGGVALVGLAAVVRMAATKR